MDYVELAPAMRAYAVEREHAGSIMDVLRSLPEEAWQRSLVLDSEVPHESRTSFTLLAEQFPRLLRLQLRAMFDACLRDYNRSFRTGAKVVQKVAVLRYLPGGTYRPHVDSSWKSYRVVSGLAYLDPSAYEGGETWFPIVDVDVKPLDPSIVLFPSNYAYVHEARPVLSGVKYVAVTWIHDLPDGDSLVTG